MYMSTRAAYRQLIPGITIGFFVLLGLIILGGLTQIGSLLVNYQWQYFGFALIVSLANYILRFLKRQHYYARAGVSRTSFGKSLKLFLASFPLKATPYTIGESYKGLWLSRAFGVPVERAVSIYLADHLFDALSILLISVFGTFAFPALWPLFLVVVLLFIASIFLLRVKPATQGFLDFSDKVPLLDKITPAIQKCINANPDLFKLGPMAITFLIGLSSWFAEGIALYLILLGFGLQASWPLLSISIFIYSFALVTGMVTNLPGGLGVVELSLTLFLTLLLGIGPERAVAATVLFRLGTFWIGFLIGMIIWKFSGKSLGIYPQEGRIIES